jgi:hypothetical protein
MSFASGTQIWYGSRSFFDTGKKIYDDILIVNELSKQTLKFCLLLFHHHNSSEVNLINFRVVDKILALGTEYRPCLCIGTYESVMVSLIKILPSVKMQLTKIVAGITQMT